MNAFTAPEVRTPAPLVVKVSTDSRDRAIVAAYLQAKSLRKVAALLFVSHDTVSAALDRFSRSLARTNARTTVPE